MISATEARRLQELRVLTGLTPEFILQDIESNIRKALHEDTTYINYFRVDWRDNPDLYNVIMSSLEDTGYEVEYIPSFDDRDPRDKPYLTIRW